MCCFVRGRRTQGGILPRFLVERLVVAEMRGGYGDVLRRESGVLDCACRFDCAWGAGCMAAVTWGGVACCLMDVPGVSCCESAARQVG
jgi:hypothetical protein